jgi:beta-ketoacyl-acyl-carrier-protein synthase II
MKNTRAAITGIGIVSPIGNNVTEFWENLLHAKSGIAEIAQFDASKFTCHIAAEVKNFELSKKKFGKLLKYTVPFTQFALGAAQEAFEDAGILPTATTASRWGVVTGSGMMTTEWDYWVKFQQTYANNPEGDIFFKKNADFANVVDLGKTLPNSGLALLLEQFQIKGCATSVHTACASGGQALGLGLEWIRRGEADYVLAGGFDSMINPVGLSSFCLLGALSTYNDTPTTASRPFDYTRAGFVLGEGAAFLVLENLDKAKARGARIYAELAGEGNSLSSYRITDSHPSGDGAIQAIEGALRSGNLTMQDIDYINAHGTSTKMNDYSETNAIKAVFKDRAKKIPVSSTKSVVGHLIAGAGALEGAISALAIYHGKVPMTANLTTPDPDCDLDYVTEGVRTQTVNAVLSNSFGFGGSNSCLLFKNPEYESKGSAENENE